MSTEQSQVAERARPESGALLLCRAAARSVVPDARLLHERMLLARAGDEWSVLVPEGGPWRSGTDPVDRVVNGWAIALTVAFSWPVLALWWDGERTGFTLATGFCRPVGYVWLADGTPAGTEEAMRTFAGRLGLDPVLDMQALDELTKPDSAADASTRLRGVLAVLTHAGVSLPPGLVPGENADGLLEAARLQPDTRRIEADESGEKSGEKSAAGRPDGTAAPHPAPRPSRAGGPSSVPVVSAAVPVPALVQMAAGLPLALWGLRHRSGGWIVAGTLLLAQGAVTLATHTLTHPRG
ncbi:hypothetical protein [Streptomyces sp. KMM 9044]|uniref:hypothetical protein n=1 Tax=Streptomyces sp. KMM 9044 TaxID=2744474 RepID=UPI00215141E3|nr:hypothetical protein [Streptomyces sp. KMM 9044]WAX78005.1 hypothetical protein HUV60_010280 [Streptomyces sp. KMM 9044]